MQQPGPPHSKTGLATSLSGFNPGKIPLFVAILSRGRHDSTKDKIVIKKILDDYKKDKVSQRHGCHGFVRGQFSFSRFARRQ
jgi:hypothetical protein